MFQPGFPSHLGIVRNLIVHVITVFEVGPTHSCSFLVGFACLVSLIGMSEAVVFG